MLLPDKSVLNVSHSHGTVTSSQDFLKRTL